jgi:hypothetical protein
MLYLEASRVRLTNVPGAGRFQVVSCDSGAHLDQAEDPLKIVKSFALWVLCQIALPCIPIAQAQQPADPPAAPVPRQIADGRKVFISNASGESATPSGVADLTYSEFYRDIKSWGRYEIVSAPADADLVFEIRFTSQLGPTSVISGAGGSGQDFQFRLVILDPRTRIVLWAFTESVPQAANHAASRKKFDDAMTTLVNDLRKLAGQKTPANDNAQK